MVDQIELERQYFARGKEICGPKAGGLLARYLKAKGGAASLDGLALARAAVEMAATKQNPREWFAGAVKAAEPAPPGGARAALFAAEWDRKSAEMLADRGGAREPTEAEKAAVARRAAEFRRTIPPDVIPPRFTTGQPTPHGSRVRADLAARAQRNEEEIW